MKSAVLVEAELAAETTVLVADGQMLVRAGLKMLVANLLGPVRFLEASDGDSLLRIAGMSPRLRLALVDLAMPGMQGGFRLAELAHRRPNIPLVVLSALSSPDVVRRAMNLSSVYACVPKSAGTGSLRSAIEAALRGDKWLAVQTSRGRSRPPVALTPRQAEVHGLLRQGMSNKMIAGVLGISQGTVKNHVTEIFRTLNATNRTQAAQFGFDEGAGHAGPG